MIKKRGSYDSPLQQERRREILCNTRSLLESEGLDGVSMARIASMSKVSTKTLYNIFVSRDRLLLQTATARLNELLLQGRGRLEAPGIPSILARTEIAMEQFIDSPDFMKVIISIMVGSDAYADGSQPNMGSIQGFTVDALLLARQNHELLSTTDIHEVSRLLAANQWGMTLMWQQELLSLEQLVRQANLINIITLLPFCIGDRHDWLQERLDKQLAEKPPQHHNRQIQHSNLHVEKPSLVAMR